jgi:hypothetical protein
MRLEFPKVGHRDFYVGNSFTNEDSFCHRYMYIVHQASGLLQGRKKKLQSLQIFKFTERQSCNRNPLEMIPVIKHTGLKLGHPKL